MKNKSVLKWIWTQILNQILSIVPLNFQTILSSEFAFKTTKKIKLPCKSPELHWITVIRYSNWNSSKKNKTMLKRIGTVILIGSFSVLPLRYAIYCLLLNLVTFILSFESARKIQVSFQVVQSPSTYWNSLSLLKSMSGLSYISGNVPLYHLLSNFQLS